MPLYSLSYIYLYLPAMLLLVGLFPVRLRAAALLSASILSYFWLEGSSNLVLLLSVLLFDWLMSGLLEHCDRLPRVRQIILWCAIGKSALVFLLIGLWDPLFQQSAPLGIGVVCLTSLGYVIDCYNGYALWERSPIHLLLLGLFFPKLYAGPIVSYGRTIGKLCIIRIRLVNIGEGYGLFVRGLVKKVLIGDTIIGLFWTLKAVPFYETYVLTVWVMLLTLALALFFLLSGMCDMARGIALMFGIELPENFQHPYNSLSINEFFSRFNSTVNRFIRRHVYLNLGGAKGSFPSSASNILLATILMGLWFGIRINMVLWGAYFTVFLLIERYVLQKYLELIPPLFRWLYSTFVILVSFVFLAGDGPSQSLRYLQVMFGLVRAAMFDKNLLYLLNSNWLVLLIAGLWACGLPRLVSNIARKLLPRVWPVVGALGNVALLVVVTAYLL